MLSKVVRVLISRHLKKLQEREAAMAGGLAVDLEEKITNRELEDVS